MTKKHFIELADTLREYEADTGEPLPDRLLTALGFLLQAPESPFRLGPLALLRARPLWPVWRHDQAESIVTPETIRALRAGLGLSRAALAAHLGVSIFAVAKWEEGVRNPCCKYMRREPSRLSAKSQRLQKKGETDD